MPRKLIEHALRKKCVIESYVKAVMKMYEGVVSQVKIEGCCSGQFSINVGVHQGSVLSPLLFAIVMDVVTEEVAIEGRALLYADDLVLICETKEEARRRVTTWRKELESSGLKVNLQ